MLPEKTRKNTKKTVGQQRPHPSLLPRVESEFFSYPATRLAYPTYTV